MHVCVTGGQWKLFDHESNTGSSLGRVTYKLYRNIGCGSSTKEDGCILSLHLYRDLEREMASTLMSL